MSVQHESEPKLFLMGAVQYVMYVAMANNTGRNWRRIKREVNKAAKRARLRPNG